MTLDEFLIDDISPQVYDAPNFLFWVETVVDAMALLGPDTDANLERLTKRLLNYYSRANITPEDVDGIRHEIVRLRGAIFWGESSPIALKYRVLNAIASSREHNLSSGYEAFLYGITTAFQNINYYRDKDQVLIDLIRRSAATYRVDLMAGKEQQQNPALKCRSTVE